MNHLKVQTNRKTKHPISSKSSNLNQQLSRQIKISLASHRCFRNRLVLRTTESRQRLRSPTRAATNRTKAETEKRSTISTMPMKRLNRKQNLQPNSRRTNRYEPFWSSQIFFISNFLGTSLPHTMNLPEYATARMKLDFHLSFYFDFHSNCSSLIDWLFCWLLESCLVATNFSFFVCIC